MSEPERSGEYIWRSGERIPLVREDEFITFVLEDERDLQAAREIDICAPSNNGALSGDRDTTLYRVVVGSRLTVSLEGPGGKDFDLYVKHNGMPSTTDYDARGFGPTADESITIDPLEPGEYQILVRSYRGSVQHRVKVETG